MQRLSRSKAPSWRRIFLFAGTIGVVGVVAILLTHAAGVFVASEAENGVLGGGASRVTVSGASGGSAVRFESGATSSSCTGFPNATCTGIPSGTTLTSTTLDGSASNVTYTGMHFTNASPLRISGSNVTFINCRFPNETIFREGTGVIVTHSDFGSSVSFSSSHSVQFSYNNIHGFPADGIHITAGSSGSRSSDIVLTDNWIHQPAAFAPSHSDGIQVRGVENLTMRHNSFDMGVWYTDNGTNVLNSALFFQEANGGNTGLIIDNNYINGAGFTLYATGGIGSITNNTFGPDDHFGFVYSSVDSRFTRSGNVDTNGNPVNF